MVNEINEQFNTPKPLFANVQHVQIHSDIYPLTRILKDHM